MKYYNNSFELSLVYFGRGFDTFLESQLFFEEELKREIKLDPEVAIISDCAEGSFLKKQCDFNGIKIHKLNIAKIIDQLNSINNKYILLVVGDAMLLDGLNPSILIRNNNFLMCGNIEPNSKYFPISNNCELMVAGKFKYANNNVIFARRSKLIEFFEDFLSFCQRNFHVKSLAISPQFDVLFNAWYSSVYDKYKVDGEGEHFIYLNKKNYDVQERSKSIINEELVRFIQPKNWQEIEFRLF